MIASSVLLIGKGELTREQWERLFTSLTFRDAEDNEVSAFDYLPAKDAVRIPRGAWSLVQSLDVVDHRSRPRMPKLTFRKHLNAPGYEGQEEAVAAMFKHEQGQVIAPPGRGKTEVGLAFAAAARTRTLVVVHTRDLFKQWSDRCQESLGLVPGKIQGRTCQVGHITIAMAQTLRQRKYLTAKFMQQFGCLLVDEAHHGAAETWEWIVNECPAYFRFGLTASEKRSDGRQPLVKFNIGPVIYKLKFKSAVPMTIVPVATDFRSGYGGKQWTYLIRDLVSDADRNRLIAKLIDKEVAGGNTVLVLSRQIKHLQNIGAFVGDQENVKLVTGRLPQRMRDKLIQQLRDGEIRCILGTQLFEEGVDIPQINRLILAFPGTEITVLQKIGRGARISEGKTETIVYDLVDRFSVTLSKQYIQRKTWYKGKENLTVAKSYFPSKEANHGKKKLKGADFIRSLKPRRP